jgi:TetR/AcrR family transcriptional regulator, mexJK operon transcriptional repressor
VKGERPSSSPPGRKVGTRGRPSNGEIEIRKHGIIVAARRVFAHKGYVGATVKDIAQAAGVGKKTIYEHIGDKAELFRVAYGTSTSKEGPHQFELPRGTSSARVALRSLARQVLEDALHPDNIALERALMLESTRFPELAQDVIRSAKAQSRRRLSTAFDDMVKRKLLMSADTTRAATYFFAIVAASDALKAIQGYRDTFPDDAELDSRVDMFLYGHLGKNRSC